jgi:hypothetical protein
MTSIVLSSSLSKDAYDNHGGDFTNVLNQVLNFTSPNEQCSVALAEVVYVPDTWPNIRDGFNQIEISMFGFETLNLQKMTIYADFFGYTYVTTKPGNYGKEKKFHFNRYRANGKFYSVWAIRWDPTRKLYVFHCDDFLGLSGDDNDATVKNEYNRKSLEILGQREETHYEKKTRTFKITPGLYPNLTLLTNKIRDNVHETIMEIFDTSLATSAVRNLPKWAGVWFWLEVESETKKIELYLMKEFSEITAFEIRFSRALQYQLGLTDYLNADLGWIPINTMLNYTYNYWNESKTFPELRRNTLRSLWVFCDIIQASLVGNNMQQLLRFMPVDTSTHQISYEVFGNLQFHPIARSSIQTIRIWFSETHDGQPIFMNSDTQVRLEFKYD